MPLESAKEDANENFSEKSVGQSEEPCPLKQKALIKAEWSPKEAWCCDQVHLLGTARNFIPNTPASADIAAQGKRKIDTLQGKGQNSFKLPWKVKVNFSGEPMPAEIKLDATLTAGGFSKKTEEPLVIKRVPDKAPEAVSFNCSSGAFRWQAAFKVGVSGSDIKLEQTLQIKKAWLGKWVRFDQAQDGRNDWSWIKKDGAQWKFWNKTANPKAWANLPRAIGNYTVNNVTFIKVGNKYLKRKADGTGDAAQEWPEAFAEPPTYEAKKTAWLANIHSVWHDKFDFKVKDCNHACAKWRMKFKCEWSDAAGDKLVYGVWAQEWERSNAKDWYLTEHRAGVAAHECGHLLGAYDEYTGGALDPATSKVEADTIMGQNLTKGKPRHLNNLRDQVKKKFKAWTGRDWDLEVKDA